MPCHEQSRSGKPCNDYNIHNMWKILGLDSYNCLHWSTCILFVVHHSVQWQWKETTNLLPTNHLLTLFKCILLIIAPAGKEKQLPYYMEYIVHGSKVQNNNKISLERNLKRNVRRFDLLQNIIKTCRIEASRTFRFKLRSKVS